MKRYFKTGLCTGVFLTAVIVIFQHTYNFGLDVLRNFGVIK